MGDLTNFYVAAHSYGGYIMGSYASLHPQHVRKLLLLSPLGVKAAPENFSFSRMTSRRYQRGRGPPAWARPIANYLWGRVNPFSLIHLRSEAKCREGIARYVSLGQGVTEEPEKTILCEYFF